MNDEVEQMMNNILKTVEQWDEEKANLKASMETATRLQLQLTVMKLMTTPAVFDELPAFSRYLKEVTDFIYMTTEHKEKDASK